MDERTKLILKQKYAVLPDEELISMISFGKEEYEPEAYDLLLAEARRRGIEESPAGHPEEKKEKPETEAMPSGQDNELLTYVQLMIVVNGSDRRSLESILDTAHLPYYLQALNIRGKEWPMALMVEQSRYEDAIELLSRRFKSSGSLILW